MENRITVETTVVLDRKIKRVVDYAHRRCHFPESLTPLIFSILLFGMGIFLLLPIFDSSTRQMGMGRLTAAFSAPAIFFGSYWLTRRRQIGRYWEYEDDVETAYMRRMHFRVWPSLFAVSCVGLTIVEIALAAWFSILVGIGWLAIYTFFQWRGLFKKRYAIVNAGYKMCYVFTEDKISFSNQSKPALPYTLIRYTVETEDYFVLFENEVLAHVIPKDQIVEGDEEQLRWLLQAQVDSVVQYCDVELDFKKCKRLFFIATTAILALATLLTVLF